jgi:hypothetical protein
LQECGECGQNPGRKKVFSYGVKSGRMVSYHQNIHEVGERSRLCYEHNFFSIYLARYMPPTSYHVDPNIPLLFDMIKKEETIIIKHNWPDGPIQ